MLDKLDRNLRVLRDEWDTTKQLIKIDWDKDTLHSRTAGVHASLIEGMPRLWFYKFWPQWLWVGWMADQVYNGGALWTYIA